MDNSREMVSLIAGITFMIENFPDNILNSDFIEEKRYDSVFDMVCDIMMTLGYSPRDIMYAILDIILQPSRGKIRDFFENTSDTLENVDEIFRSEWLDKLDAGVKGVIASGLSGLFSCTVDPMLGDGMMDPHSIVNIGNIPGQVLPAEGKITIPIEEVDPLGLLDYCPSGYAGRFLYHGCDGLGVNELYKSEDLNAFIWYVLNIHNGNVQREVNKAMWDNRYDIAYKRSKDEWNEWLSSKTHKAYSEEDEKSILSIVSNNKIKPIFQLSRESIGYGTKLVFQISSQEYYRKRKIGSKLAFNKTLAEFNYDYLNSIRIFSVKSIVFGIMNAMAGGLNILNYSSYYSVINRVALRDIIRKIIKNPDITINDDYYSFDNSEYERIINENEMRKYMVKRRESATGSYVPKDTVKEKEIMDGLFSKMNDGDASLNEIRNTIDGSMTELVLSDNSVDFQRNKNQSVIDEFLIDLIEQLLMPILTPKIMLLYAFNYKVQGYDFDVDFNIILKKMETLIINLIYHIIVLNILPDLLRTIEKKLTDILVKYSTLRLLESIQEYILLLNEALANYTPRNILLIKDTGFFKKDGSIDDVRGAEI